MVCDPLVSEQARESAQGWADQDALPRLVRAQARKYYAVGGKLAAFFDRVVPHPCLVALRRHLAADLSGAQIRLACLG